MRASDEILGRILDQLVNSQRLAIVAGLEALLASVDVKTPDRVTAALLQALVQSDVSVIIASRSRRSVIDAWSELVHGIWWVAESGSWRRVDSWQRGPALEPIDAWIGRLLPGADVIAIGDGFVIDEFPQLGRYELAVIEPESRTYVRRRLRDVGDVHDVLWRVVRDRDQRS